MEEAIVLSVLKEPEFISDKELNLSLWQVYVEYKYRFGTRKGYLFFDSLEEAKQVDKGYRFIFLT